MAGVLGARVGLGVGTVIAEEALEVHGERVCIFKVVSQHHRAGHDHQLEVEHDGTSGSCAMDGIGDQGGDAGFWIHRSLASPPSSACHSVQAPLCTPFHARMLAVAAHHITAGRRATQACLAQDKADSCLPSVLPSSAS